MNNENDALNNEVVSLQSFGAAETVTGSKHLLQTPDLNILVDCGLFQGMKSLRERNWEMPPAELSAVDVMILTHAHLDHCGYIPLFVKNGYRGKIYMSPPTRDLAELILRDSAKLQEEDADKANRRGYSKHRPAEPLYTTKDVETALQHFVTLEPGQTFGLNDHICFKFFPAGHILGACSLEINCYGKTIVFSGDLGRYHSELLPPPVHPVKADFVVMESTYGDRLHGADDPAEAFALAIKDTVFRRGNLLIPCFAVGRAQDVMHILWRLKNAQIIPQSIPVFLDSPMAASAGRSLLKYADWLTLPPGEAVQMFSGVTINQDYRLTEKTIRQKGSKIVLAASGMLTGGRVLEYLKHYLVDARNTVLMIGYQAEGTRGRALLNQVPEIKIHGQYYPVKARILGIGGLSAHADQTELLTWIKGFEQAPNEVFLVHGEPCAQEAFRVKLKDELRVPVTIMKEGRPKLLFRINRSELKVLPLSEMAKQPPVSPVEG
ncbi:MBL fold metallo-hydrolase RNA specificity domain-containing protein [Mucilaginibacter sp. OK283]|uniref:MBL fold metallo-hydrolase RNA specificity domain-containing protein n=1 Tax=Mucilaginibacter sp. OK283 TaxID=1881049 RepID=UPI0008B0C560|nr:MBL fold metallo-hydrolase [Mucilaginibacter sp. OK283]SEP41600.1 metallo-beta-lactamase family protein [Mucilaginibacter sp. OK283]